MAPSDARSVDHDPRGGRYAVAAALTLAGLLGGHTLLEVARDSMFLTRLGAEQLPLTYLMIAGLAAAAAQVDRRLLEPLRDRLPALTLMIAAVGAVGFYFLFGGRATWVPHALYVWEGVVATLAVAQFWRLLSEIFTVAEAKRLYTRIAATGSLGAMGGAAAAELALRFLEPRDLLWMGAGVYVLTAALPHRLLPRTVAIQKRRVHPEEAASRRVHAKSYVRRLVLLVGVTAVAATMVDYVFKSTVDANVAHASLGPLFSRFYFGLNLLSLLIQLFLAPWLFRILGVSRGLVLLPALLLAGALGAFAFGGIAIAMGLKGLDGAFRNSLHRSALEMLYFPLSQSARHRYKALIDALGQRGGQTVGSLVILGAGALGLGARELALGVAALASFWVVLSLSMRARYLDLFRANLRSGTLRTTVEVPTLDLHSLESLMTALNSDRDEEVLAALELLADYDRVRLIPALVLYHPSPQVVLRALELLSRSGRSDHLPIVRRLREHADPEVQAAATHAALGELAASELRAELERAHPTAASAAALVAIVSRGFDEDGSARAEVLRCAREAPAEVRRAIARAVRLRGDPALSEVLHALVPGAGAELRREIARAFGAARDERAVPVLIEWLGPRGSRAEARDALVAIGEPARAALVEALSDEALPRQVRGHIPRTLSRFGDRASAEALFEHLDAEQDGWVRYKILRALRALRDALPDLRFDDRRHAHTRRALTRAARMLSWRISLGKAHAADPALRTRGGELLEPVLREKEHQALDRAVRLVALDPAFSGVRGLTQALASDDRRLRAESAELLSSLAHPSVGPALAAMIDDGAEEARLAGVLSRLREPAPRPIEYVELLRALIEDESDAVRSIAAHHVGELGLTELADVLARVHEREDSALAALVVSHALERLRDAKRVGHG